ncbi:MAG TPA: carboxypeptidase regulatory-like domain-containing protein [Bryobacteraceae bacterium]|nr:carboxypeptidase regulatory-like domain-containing protein [Bryobacteraceae bacterium]
MRILSLWIFAVAAVFAQQTASLRGILTDSSGAVIPAATVSLNGNGAKKSVQTQADGTYLFPGLTAGDYKLSVNYPGFVAYEHAVTIQPGIASQNPIQLIPGGGKQEVNVTSEVDAAVSVDPNENKSAVVLKDNDLNALPDDPDDLSDMLTALAGPSAGNGDAPAMLVDGFSGGTLPPKNTIKEIRLNQNPFTAESEYLGFGRVEIITKPGTDTLHGTFQLTDSDAFFNSRNPYAANKADYVNRAFTESLGGSIAKKLSWSLSANQNKVDTDAIIHAVTLDTATLLSSPEDLSVLTPRDNYSGTGRVDYQISTNHTATARYTYSRNNRDNSGIGGYSLLSQAYSGEGDSQELQLSETAVISPALATETRLLYSVSDNYQYGDTTVPSINVSGSFIGGGNQVGHAYNKYRRSDLQNISTYVHGVHTVRFGVRWIRASLDDNSPSNFGGTFTFFGVGNAPGLDSNNQPIPNTSISISSLEQYRRTLLFQSLGYPMSTIRSLGGGASLFSIAGGRSFQSISQDQFEAFAQDDWRIRPNVTLSIGFRHEQQSDVHVYPVPIAPRLSLAWSPGSTASKPGKTVIRLGTGIFYDRFGTYIPLQAARFNGYNQQQYLVTDPGFFGTVPSLTTLAAQQQPPVTWRISKDMRPDIDTVSAATLERQLPKKSTLSVTYLYIHGDHFPIIVNVNTPLPGTYEPADPTGGVRPYGNAAGNIFEYQSNGIYRQKLTMVKWDSKVSKNISFTLNYTLQFSNHDGNWLATPSNPYNFMADFGRAGYDRRHQLNLVGNFNLPFHFQFSPMFVASSGAPYDLTIGHDLNGDSFGSDRPTFATDLTRPSVVFTQFGAFDTDPIPGQTLVPHNYLLGTGMWNLNGRFGRTFVLGRHKAAAAGAASTPAAGGTAAGSGSSTSEGRYKLNLNIEVNNVFNHLSPGGFVGNLSSPLFGQSTSPLLFRETSNLRRVQFGTTFSF